MATRKRYESGARRGRGAEANGEPLEAITMAYRMLLHPVHRSDMLRTLLKRDSEMADLAIGAMFRYDP